MKLPKLYRPVEITFWSLRMGIGQNMGVIFDCDVRVSRVCMRVLCSYGWKWSIKDYYDLVEWDDLVETDQDILNEYGIDVEVEITAAGEGL